MSRRATTLRPAGRPLLGGDLLVRMLCHRSAVTAGFSCTDMVVGERPARGLSADRRGSTLTCILLLCLALCRGSHSLSPHWGPLPPRGPCHLLARPALHGWEVPAVALGLLVRSRHLGPRKRGGQGWRVRGEGLLGSPASACLCRTDPCPGPPVLASGSESSIQGHSLFPPASSGGVR